MQQFIGTSLKTRLYLLVLAAFIPVAVLSFYVAREQKTLETEAILQKALVMARLAANEENRQVASTRNLLTVVADGFMAVGGSVNRLSGLLADLMRHSKGYVDIGVLDPQGRLVANGDPSDAQRDYSASEWFLASLQNRQLAMGQYHGERIDDEPVLYFTLPALDKDRRIAAVVYAALNLNGINRTIFERLAELPKGSRLTLLDETQAKLRYDADTRQWSVPQHFNPTLREEIVSRQAGALSATDEIGTERIYAFAPLDSSFQNRRIAIVLEIPRARALAASKRIFTRTLVLLAASALIAVLSIWWAGEVLILRRVRAMVRASRELASGDLGVRIGDRGVRDELSHLATVFDEMAASLEQRIAREAQVTASLAQSREQLRSLAAYQQDVREQERIRIAREIHDQLGQSLTILRMDLAWLKHHLENRPPAMDEKMDDMSGVIAEALARLQTVTAELRPVILDDFGIAAAIEWQAEEFRGRSGIDCRVEIASAEPDLPKDQATTLFRIFQETLTNIIRHADADEVTVRLAADDGVVTLEVRDNGCGITEAAVNDPGAFGLLGIRERLYPWSGSATFEGRPGQGTCVTIQMPETRKGALQ